MPKFDIQTVRPNVPQRIAAPVQSNIGAALQQIGGAVTDLELRLEKDRIKSDQAQARVDAGLIEREARNDERGFAEEAVADPSRYAGMQDRFSDNRDGYQESFSEGKSAEYQAALASNVIHNTNLSLGRANTLTNGHNRRVRNAAIETPFREISQDTETLLSFGFGALNAKTEQAVMDGIALGGDPEALFRKGQKSLKDATSLGILSLAENGHHDVSRSLLESDEVKGLLSLDARKGLSDDIFALETKAVVDFERDILLERNRINTGIIDMQREGVPKSDVLRTLSEKGLSDEEIDAITSTKFFKLAYPPGKAVRDKTIKTDAFEFKPLTISAKNLTQQYDDILKDKDLGDREKAEALGEIGAQMSTLVAQMQMHQDKGFVSNSDYVTGIMGASKSMQDMVRSLDEFSDNGFWSLSSAKSLFTGKSNQTLQSKAVDFIDEVNSGKFGIDPLRNSEFIANYGTFLFLNDVLLEPLTGDEAQEWHNKAITFAQGQELADKGMTQEQAKAAIETENAKQPTPSRHRASTENDVARAVTKYGDIPETRILAQEAGMDADAYETLVDQTATEPVSIGSAAAAGLGRLAESIIGRDLTLGEIAEAVGAEDIKAASENVVNRIFRAIEKASLSAFETIEGLPGRVLDVGQTIGEIEEAAFQSAGEAIVKTFLGTAQGVQAAVEAGEDIKAGFAEGSKKKKEAIVDERILNAWTTAYQGTNDDEKTARASKVIEDFIPSDVPDDARESIDKAVDIFGGDKGENKRVPADILKRALEVTGAIESDYRTKVQGGGGPARSYWQVEPATAIDVLKNGAALLGAKFKSAFGDPALLQNLNEAQIQEKLLNDQDFAAAMAAAKYIMSADDILGEPA